MNLLEFQRLLSPHTRVTLWAYPRTPALFLWAGEIESCDFSRYGDREVVSVDLLNRTYYQGFYVYIDTSPQ